MFRRLMGDPILLNIDEPPGGSAPKRLEQVGYLLDETAWRGRAILLLEQQLAITLKTQHRFYVLGQGRIGFSGSPAERQTHTVIRKE